MARRDAFPEETEYRDTGCDAAPSCLRCPFVECRYDSASGGLASLRGRALQLRARELRAEGRSIAEIVEALGRGKRQVLRYLA